MNKPQVKQAEIPMNYQSEETDIDKLVSMVEDLATRQYRLTELEKEYESIRQDLRKKDEDIQLFLQETEKMEEEKDALKSKIEGLRRRRPSVDSPKFDESWKLKRKVFFALSQNSRLMTTRQIAEYINGLSTNKITPSTVSSTIGQLDGSDNYAVLRTKSQNRNHSGHFYYGLSDWFEGGNPLAGIKFLSKSKACSK